MRIFSASSGLVEWMERSASHQFFDFALVEQALLVDFDPGFLADCVIGV